MQKLTPVTAQIRSSYHIRVWILALFTLGLGWLLMKLEFRQWLARLDGWGSTRQDGKQFAWNTLASVELVRMGNRADAPPNHVELRFRDGVVKVFHRMLVNQHAVLAELAKLPGGEALASLA